MLNVLLSLDVYTLTPFSGTTPLGIHEYVYSFAYHEYVVLIQYAASVKHWQTVSTVGLAKLAKI